MIRVYMATHNIYQKDMARKVGMNEHALSRFLAKETDLNGSNIVKLVSFVLAEENDPNIVGYGEGY